MMLQDFFIRRSFAYLLALCLLISFLYPPPCYSSTVLSGEGDNLSSWINPLLGTHSGKSGAYVLDKGEEALLARAWLTDRAEKTIYVQYFIWSTDNIGILAAEALLRAADRGVQIKVIVDDLLIDAPSESMLALAAHPNIDIKIYNPKHSVGVSTPERIVYLLTDFRSANQRMHDKTFIVDGRVAITGGRNMADEYFDYNQEYNFRDRDVLLMGPVVSDMEASFEEFFDSPHSEAVKNLLKRKSSGLDEALIQRVYEELHGYADDPENFAPEVRQALEDLPQKFPVLLDQLVWEDIEFIHDLPGKNEHKIGLGGGGRTTSRLIEAVQQAERSIVIQSPYLVMPKGAVDFFKGLIARGVEVTINTNSMGATDNLQAFSGYKKQRRKILKTGIRVFEFRPHPEHCRELIERYEAIEKNIPIFAIHAKTMVIDRKTVFIGTFNFDPRSANLNTEVGVLISNEKLAGRVEDAIKYDMAEGNSWDAAADNPDRHAPFFKKVKIDFWELLPLKSLL